MIDPRALLSFHARVPKIRPTSNNKPTATQAHGDIPSPVKNVPNRPTEVVKEAVASETKMFVEVDASFIERKSDSCTEYEVMTRSDGTTVVVEPLACVIPASSLGVMLS